MIYPVNLTDQISDIINKVQTLQDLKHTQRNVDETTKTLLSMLRNYQKSFSEFLQINADAQDRQNQMQLYFCERLKIEFSNDADFDYVYQTWNADDWLIDTETLKTIVDAERKMQNLNNCYLHARITLIDSDPEVLA